MSNRKVNNSSTKRPSPPGSGGAITNFVDLTAFGFSVIKKPRPSPSRAAAPAAAGGVEDLTTLASSPSSDSSGSSIVAIVDPPAAAGRSRGTTTTATAKAKNHRTATTASAAVTRTATAGSKSTLPPPSLSSPVSDVEYIGTSPSPLANKRSRLFKNDLPAGAGKENSGVATTTTTAEVIFSSTTTATSTAAAGPVKKVASSLAKQVLDKGDSNSNMTASASSGVAAATSPTTLDVNSSFASAKSSLSLSSSSSRAALLDLTIDGSVSDSSSNKQRQQKQKQQQPQPITGKRPNVELSSSGAGVSSGGGVTIVTDKAAKPKTMTTLSDMADSLANEIHQYHHQQQQQQQQQQQKQQNRRAKRDKHPVATNAPTPLRIAIFEEEISSAPHYNTGSVSAKNAPSTVVAAAADATVLSPLRDDHTVVNEKMENSYCVVDVASEKNPSNFQLERNNNGEAGDAVLPSTRVHHEPTPKNEEEKEPQEEDVNDHKDIDQMATNGDSASIIAKEDYVKIFYDATDMFGDINLEWYLGMVTSAKKSNHPSHSSSQSYSIRVRFVGDDITKTFQYPAPYLEKLVSTHNNKIGNDLPELYPEQFSIGDIVDALFQDGKVDGKWYRGRIANVNDEGSVCDVMYYDGDYEFNIPTMERKIRLIQRRDESGKWLVGKNVSFSRDSCDDPFIGTISKKYGRKYVISYSDGSKDSVSYEEAAKAVFCYRCLNLPSNRKREWPGTIAKENIDTIRSRRQRKEKVEVGDDSGCPKPTVKEAIKKEPSDTRYEIKHASHRVIGDDFSDLYIPIKYGPTVDVSVLEMRKTAKDFPPGLPNMLWCALNSPEAQTGTNFLLELLCIHDSIPPTTMVQKMMDLMKYGPKADGANIYFKDPHRTELAAQLVYFLVGASNRLQRRDSAALFGPSSWNDIHVLFSQSVSETENSVPGRRLAQGLQLAARGAKLLSMMFVADLQGYDLGSTSSDVLRDPTALNDMPTVRLVKSHGVRGGLKAAVEHMTKCLVRHSRWILDSGGIELSANSSTSDETCCLEARACLDRLGSVTCFIAWLFCVEEKVKMMEPAVAFVIRDAFMAELERSMADASEQLGKQKRKEFVRKCKTYFLMSFIEEFASPLVMTLGEMLEVEDLALVGLLP